MTSCSECGVLYDIGDWPFCPHGRPTGSIITDDIPGGQVIENLGDKPMTFYSKKAIIEEASRQGLRLADHWVPGDKYLTNWGASIDPQTLENAKVLLSRGSRQTQSPEETTASALETFTGHIRHRGVTPFDEHSHDT